MNYLLKRERTGSVGESLLLLLLAVGRRVPALGVVRGGQQHGEEQQQRHQQVRDVDGGQQQALPRGPGTGVGFRGELMEKDVAQDGEQRGGHMDGVHDGRSPDPLTAA